MPRRRRPGHGSMQGVTDRFCLRCKDVALASLSPVQDIAFFECPQCRRQYALKPGKDLTFRWGHPISHLLYPVIFSTSPLAAEVNRVVRTILETTSESDRKAAVEETVLELNDPTQKLVDILDCRASEAELREYLSAVCDHIRNRT
jgi:hypothetical protein